MKQITYFIEFIPYWSPGDQEDAHEFLTQFLQIEERYLQSTFSALINLIISDTSAHKLL